MTPSIGTVCSGFLFELDVDQVLGDCSPTFVELERRLSSMKDNLLQDLYEVEKKQKKKQGAALSSDDLLFQVFPKHVAKALKAGRKVGGADSSGWVSSRHLTRDLLLDRSGAPCHGDHLFLRSVSSHALDPLRRLGLIRCWLDIVGFTDISSALPAEKVMDMLDRLYTK